MSTYSVPTTGPYWVHIGFEPPFREFFIEVLDAEHRTLLVWEEFPTLDELVRAAALWTEVDCLDFGELFGLDDFPVGHPYRPFLRPERIIYRGVECKIVQKACQGTPCSGLPDLELVEANAPEQFVAHVTTCPCAELRDEPGATTIVARTYPGVTELLAEAGVVVTTGREIQLGNIKGAKVVRVTEPAARVYLDPDRRPGWQCWRFLQY